MLSRTLLRNSSLTLEAGRAMTIWRPAQRPCHPRALEVRIGTGNWTGSCARGPVLWARCLDGTVITYALPIDAATRSTDALLLVDEPFDTLGFPVPPGSPALHLEAVCVTAIGSLGLARAAIQRDPAAAAGAFSHYLTGRRRRARHRIHRLLGLARGKNYQRWRAATADRAQAELLTLSRRVELKAAICAMAVVIIDDGTSAGVLPATEALIEAGIEAASIVTAAPGRELGAIVASLAAAPAHQAQWVWLLFAGSMPADGALLRAAAYLHDHPEVCLLYGDHDHVDIGLGRHTPHFKPDWNAPLFWSGFDLGSVLVRGDLLARTLRDRPATGRDDLLVSLTADRDRDTIGHIPAVLFHEPSRPAPPEQARDARSRHLERSLGGGARVTRDSFGNHRVRFALPEPPPRVSLIVPTRDRLDLLAPCIEGLRHRTEYPDLEILIADNGSTDRATLAHFESLAADPVIRIVAMPGPFNFAAINDRAAELASGQVLGFINNDIEVLEPHWLGEMVAWAIRPDIGAVGGRLLYPNGLVQHAGVILGVGGLAGHAHRFLSPNHPGFTGRLQCHQVFSAVTAAAMVVERAKFKRVGGFDADAFAVNFNDVDLCLRLDAASYRTLWTPYAELLHKETSSRPLDFSPERVAQFERETQALRQRWGAVIANDPCYSPHLTRDQEDFGLAAGAAPDQVADIEPH